MTNFFAQIRKQTTFGSLIKELSDRIDRTSAIDDDDTSLRLIRIDTDGIHYTDTDSNSLEGDKTDTDTITYSDLSANLTMGKAFRVPGGDFLTFHVEAASTKMRDFIAGSGGFFRSTDERAYVGYSEVS